MPKPRKPLRRLKPEEKRLLAGLLERGNLTHKQIANYFGLTRSAVTAYAKQWQKILASRRRHVNKQQRSHEQIVADVRKAVEARGYFTNIRELARIVGVSKTTIEKILTNSDGFVRIPLTRSSRPAYLITTRNPENIMISLEALGRRSIPYLLTAIEWMIENDKRSLIGILDNVRNLLIEKQQNARRSGSRKTENRIIQIYNRLSEI